MLFVLVSNICQQLGQTLEVTTGCHAVTLLLRAGGHTGSSQVFIVM